MTEKASLTPPDPERCQAEKPNGCSFMSFGGVPKLVRCTNKPLFIITERDPGEDGQKGSMSLCASCLARMNEQLPDKHVAITCIEEKRK